jgi:hypothetical protein
MYYSMRLSINMLHASHPILASSLARDREREKETVEYLQLMDGKCGKIRGNQMSI